jgi:hypothetical protein
MSDIIEARLKKLISVALSCNMCNTEDWMDYLCAEINAALSDIGDPDRFEFKGSLIIKKVNPPMFRCADRDDGCGHCERSEPHEHPDEQPGDECYRRKGRVTCERV